MKWKSDYLLPGETPAPIDENFVPIFDLNDIDLVFYNVSDELLDLAQQICGTNPECLFDILLSGDAEMGQGTVNDINDIESSDNQTFNCIPICQNDGICISEGKCNCTQGFYGTRCEFIETEDLFTIGNTTGTAFPTKVPTTAKPTTFAPTLVPTAVETTVSGGGSQNQDSGGFFR